jgi:hypothetical protein
MKKIKQLFFFSVFTFLLVSIAQGQKETPNLPIDSSTGKITYSEVVTLNDSISKTELFGRAKTCFVHLFKNANSVIQNEDKEAGSIIGKGTLKVYAKALGMTSEAGYVNFTLTLAIKEGRYKFTITDFAHEGTGKMPSGGNLENGKPKMWVVKQWNSILSQTDEETKNLISSIKLEMSKPSPQNEKW